MMTIRFKAVVSFLCLGLVLLSWAAPASPQPVTGSPPVTAPAAGSVPGEIQAFIVKGSVEMTDAAGKTTPLATGVVFGPGTTITTSAGGETLLVMSNGTILHLLPESEVVFSKFDQWPFSASVEGTFLRINRDPSRSDSIVTLHYGAVAGEVKQLNLAAGSSFEIDTILGVTKIRGTIFRVNLTKPAGSPPGVAQTTTCAVGVLAFFPVVVGPPAGPMQWSIGTCSALTSSGEFAAGGGLAKISNVWGLAVAAAADAADVVRDLNLLANQARLANGFPVLPPISLPPPPSISTPGRAAGTAAPQTSIP